jgi:hypothetical protein
MYSQDTGSTAGPDLVLMRNNPNNGANNEYIGQIRYEGLNDDGNSLLYAKTTGKIKTATKNSEDGVIETMIKTGGSNRISVRHSGDKFLIQKGTDLQVGEVANLYVDTSTSRVGIGTSSPQERFHLYGSPIIQHETRYDVGANDGWYKIGTWDAASATGARLKISLLGSESYSAQERSRGGETIIYASINNNNPTTTSNMSGSIHAHGKPVITQAKFKQVGTDRTQYEIIAYVEPYTQHSMKTECSETTTFTRAWTSASDPGADSATVQAALFTHVVDNAGNVGIGTTSPLQKLEVHGNILLGDNDVHSFIHGGAGVAVSADTDILIVADSNDTSGAADAGDIIFGSGSAFNTNQNRDFTFAQAYPSNVPRNEHMRITGDGNVGIGTTNPLSPLDIKAVKGITTAATVSDLVSNATMRISGYSENHDVLCIGMLSTDTSGDSGNNPHAYIQNIWDNPKTARPLLLNPAGSEVGIGTTNPGYKLDVHGTIRYDTHLLSSSSTQRFWTSGSSTNWIQFMTSGTSTNHILDLQANDGNCVVSARDTTPLLLNPTVGGNVGIGTASPATKLHVDGSLLVGDRLPYGGNTTHTDAQLILGGAHNSSTDYNTSYQIKLLISGGDNDNASPYYIMCEDENGIDQFWVKGSTSSSANHRCHAKINDIGFAAYRSGGSDHTFETIVVFNNEYYDHGGCYSTSTGKFTAPVAGIYHFGFNAFTNQGATTQSRVYLYKNGSIYIQKGNSIDRHGNCIDTLIELAANDTVSIRGSSSYPVYMYRSQAHNIFYGHLVTAV